ncbi:MAG: hypothetical protein WCP66_13360 [Methylococcales bacterium]
MWFRDSKPPHTRKLENNPTKKLGFEGRKEGIAVQVIVLLENKAFQLKRGSWHPIDVIRVF